MTAPSRSGCASGPPAGFPETLWMRDDLDTLCSMRNRLDVLAMDYKADADLSTSFDNAAALVAKAIDRIQTLLPFP